MDRLDRLPPHIEAVCGILQWHQGGACSALQDLGELDWTAALAFANEERVTPDVYAALASVGSVGLLPADVRRYLAHIHNLNRTRNARIRHQLVEILDAWNSAGTAPLVLKSSVALLEPEAALPSFMITDIDLQIDPDASDKAIETAGVLGYRPVFDHDAGEHAYAYLVRQGEPAALDLHKELLRSAHLLPASSVRSRAHRLEVEDVSAIVPSAEDQMMHRVLHDMVHHAGHLAGTVSLRGLTEVTRIVRTHPLLDWTLMLAELKPHRAHHILRAESYAAKKLLGADVPQAVASGFAARLYFSRSVAAWRRQKRDDCPRPKHFLGKGLAYSFDPAAGLLPLPTKILRRFLHGAEPIPLSQTTMSAEQKP